MSESVTLLQELKALWIVTLNFSDAGLTINESNAYEFYVLTWVTSRAIVVKLMGKTICCVALDVFAVAFEYGVMEG